MLKNTVGHSLPPRCRRRQLGWSSPSPSTRGYLAPWGCTTRRAWGSTSARCVPRYYSTWAKKIFNFNLKILSSCVKIQQSFTLGTLCFYISWEITNYTTKFFFSLSFWKTFVKYSEMLIVRFFSFRNIRGRTTFVLRNRHSWALVR